MPNFYYVYYTVILDHLLFQPVQFDLIVLCEAEQGVGCEMEARLQWKKSIIEFRLSMCSHRGCHRLGRPICGGHVEQEASMLAAILPLDLQQKALQSTGGICKNRERY